MKASYKMTVVALCGAMLLASGCVCIGNGVLCGVGGRFV